jgi:hypothetical protein
MTNRQLVANLRETHGLCEEHGDAATASLIENWIDEAERRTWFLFEATRAKGWVRSASLRRTSRLYVAKRTLSSGRPRSKPAHAT